MKVFLTVDTEIWPDSPGWPHTPLAPQNSCNREFDSYFYGGTGARRTGLQYQLEILGRHGLKATYFVDTLFSCALGPDHLQRVVSIIEEHDQEIGLHLHPEWLTDTRCRGLPAFAGPCLRQYSESAQDALVRAGVAGLASVGIQRPSVFRAGSWGADENTLVAIRNNGFTYDTSLNPCFAESFPGLSDRYSVLHPHKRAGVWEFPVTFFLDHSPAGKRPLQVCACSFDEFRNTLESAFDAGWFAVVIVFHSFEFVRVNRLPQRKPITAQRLLARRFEDLCAYLDVNRDRFETTAFADLDPARIPEIGSQVPIRSTRTRTAMRYVEQLTSRFY